MTREETVFGCMKVFMLEHEQPQNDSMEEVFRDTAVAKFMDELIAPFALGASSGTTNTFRPERIWRMLRSAFLDHRLHFTNITPICRVV